MSGVLNWLRSVLPDSSRGRPPLLDIYEVANERSRALYPPRTRAVGDETDAARHLLGAAWLAQHLGERPARWVGSAYEWLNSDGTPAERAMDLRNNELGAALGARLDPNDRAALEDAVRRMIESREAAVLSRARGGLARYKECACHGR